MQAIEWRRPGAPAFGRLMIAVALAMLLAPFVAAAPAIGSPQAQEPPDAAAYLLVIDHSGSMQKPTRSGRSRWEEMQQRAIEFTRTLPLESRVWLAVFAGEVSAVRPYVTTLKTEAERDALIERIERGYGRPVGGTALYDTLGLAFEEAERLSARTPGRYIAVMVFTDGQDEGSKRWRNRAELEARFGQLIADNQNLWLFITPLEGAPRPLGDGARVVYGSAKVPISVRVAPPTVTLAAPSQDPAPRPSIRFDLSQQSLPFVRGQSVRLEFEPDPGDPLRLSLPQPTVPLRLGAVEVPLEVTNASQLRGDREYRGTLKLTWPQLPQHVIQGATSVSLVFQKHEPPRLGNLRPEDGQVFAAGQRIVFFVDTLQTARVTWDFGDGNSDTGHRVTHAYNTAATPRVTVQVQSGPDSPATSRTINLEIIDVGVTIDPLSGPIREGEPCRLTCTGRGGITRYEWVVDGRTFQGQDDGRALQYTFDQPGRHLVSVRAVHPKTTVESEEMEVDVAARPSIALVEPQPGATVALGNPLTFSAEVAGPVASVRWSIAAAGGEAGGAAPLFELDTPVAGTGPRRTARLEHVFPETSTQLTGGSAVVVTATGALEAGVSGNAPTDRIELTLEAPRRSVRIVKPDVGTKIYFDEEIEFVAEVFGPDLDTVAWSIDPGDGTPPVTRDTPVTADGVRRVARLRHRFAEQLSELEVEVAARGVLPAGYVTSAPADVTARPVRHRDFDFGIRVPAEAVAFAEQPVRFALEPGQGFLALEWDFGDGAVDGSQNANPVHRYDASGAYEIQARITGKGNRQYTAVTHVTITATAPSAHPDVVHDGVSTRDVKVGDVVDLVEAPGAAAGDVVRRTWLHNGEPVEAGLTSLVLEAPGEHAITLRVEGPPDRTGRVLGDEKTIVIAVLPRPDHVLFVIAAVLAAGVLLVTWRWLSGNAPLAWKIFYSNLGAPDEDADPIVAVSRHWKWWRLGRKFAEVPLHRMFIESEYWGGGPGRGESVTVDAFKVAGRWQGSLTYSGEGNDSVTCPPPTEDGKRVDYRIRDNRCREDGYKTLYLRLLRETYSPARSMLARVVIFLALAGAVWVVWHFVYRG